MFSASRFRSGCQVERVSRKWQSSGARVEAHTSWRQDSQDSCTVISRAPCDHGGLNKPSCERRSQGLAEGTTANCTNPHKTRENTGETTLANSTREPYSPVTPERATDRTDDGPGRHVDEEPPCDPAATSRLAEHRNPKRTLTGRKVGPTQHPNNLFAGSSVNTEPIITGLRLLSAH